MSDNSGAHKNNPFHGLLGGQDDKHATADTINTYNQAINSLIENVFLITLRKNLPRGKQFVYMEEVALSTKTELFSLDYLDQALFERLLLSQPADFLIPNNHRNSDTEDVIQTKAISYLFKAFVRSFNYRNDNNTIVSKACDKIDELIFRNITTASKQPELFEGQSLGQQWLEIFMSRDDDFNIKTEFLKQACKAVVVDDEAVGMGTLKSMFYPIFNDIRKRLATASMTSVEKWIVPFLRCFAQDKTNPQLAEMLLDYSTPNSGAEGHKFGETIFGQLLSLSILPKNQNSPYEFYDNPMEAASSNITSSLWGYLKANHDDMHLLFKDFLIFGGEVREKMLNWVGNCLHANVARGQIWNTHSGPMLGELKTASDSFIIGLSGVLLRLCKPLLKPQYKVLIVDPTYCGVEDGERGKFGVHMKGMDKETCLAATEENEKRLLAEKYNFVTECFFMTHKAIDLGYRVCIEKLIRMNREIHRLQGAYQDALAQHGTDGAASIMRILTGQMQQFLSLQYTIIEPTNDQLILQFYEATAIWLTQVTAHGGEVSSATAAVGYAPQTVKEVTLPIITPEVPKALKSIPEFVIENVVNYLTFSRHFETQAVESDCDAQSSIFTMILIFMGSSERARNPHLRARLAEGLESLLPKENTNSFRGSFKTILFTTHPHRLEIIPNLLNVFVAIEMTGQSVQFEQKFNYRRPMYTMMDYLWKIEEQKECFKRLAIDAETNIEAVEPPIFLRFINLLINDAIFLLDESLSNLQQIRTLQAAQDAGEWTNLSHAEQQQNRQNLQHLGMMAKFDNILGRETIRNLKLITSEIKGIFCHASMVDRVVAMLNYFLLHLVGPKKSDLKVKDKKEFEFNPANTVREICSIYVNLQESTEFCLAVSQDGRSYSPQLFTYAEEVLIRIGGGQLIGEIADLSQKVQRLEKQQKVDQAALTDPPDEYLDPIMSTLMTDPVILPSSNVTLDRPTIARHLLSDQTDPFNRSPLTMDQVKSNVELKAEITEWIRERRAIYSQKEQAGATAPTPE